MISSLKYVWSFLVMLKGLLVPVTPTVKSSGVSTTVRSPIAVRSKMKEEGIY